MTFSGDIHENVRVIRVHTHFHVALTRPRHAVEHVPIRGLVWDGSVKIAQKKMLSNFDIIKNYVVASDAFLPFKDNIKIFKNKDCKAIIQPGGAKKDSNIIEEANKLGITMYFTGIRHFKH